MTNNGSLSCHLCKGHSLELLNGYGGFHQVTSDCRPWRRGGKIAVCADCGAVQKVVDPQWQRNADEIYDSYAIYSQAGGEEQRVFDQATGVAKSRSARLVDNLLASSFVPASGRLLDVGCGNGAFLRAFSESVSGWKLAGLEVNDKHRRVIESIPDMEALYVGAVEDAPGQFDVISMIHVLEHIPNPADFIRNMKKKLSPGGMLLIEVPDLETNPFDLLIADHATHFTRQTLQRVAEAADYSPVSVAVKWIPKEISMLVCDATGSTSNKTRDIDLEAGEEKYDVHRHLQWLQSFLESAKESKGEPFGIFGTSIVGTWLAAELGDKVEFFVDEDSSRHGESFFGKPILHPDAVPDSATVFLGLPAATAQIVYARLNGSGFRLVLPPLYDAP